MIQQLQKWFSRNAPVSPAVAAKPAAPAPNGLARILRPNASQRWVMPSVASITPQYIESVLRGALTGNHVQQWELFDLMFDTWPELASCQQELIEGVMAQKIVYNAWAEEDEAPTDTAVEKKTLVSAALRQMRSATGADENDLDDTIKDILDGWFRGVTCLETEWHTVPAGKLGAIIAPRATFWAHPNYFAWGEDGRVGLNLGGGITPFPEHKFLLAIHKAKSGSALGGAMLRPLAWWWCAANFASDWLLNLAQLFGLPFRWANHDPNASQETVDAICNMLQNMGSAGWAAFPAGTTLELKDAGKSGDHSPQGDLLDRADRYARMLVLGQTMSGSQDSSKGGGKAFGEVESAVKNQRIAAAGKYACKVINTQLIPSIVGLNYGSSTECPCIDLVPDSEAGSGEASRDLILSKMMPIPHAYLRAKYNVPEAALGEPATTVNSDASLPDNFSQQLAALAGETDDAVFAKALNNLIQSS